MEFWTLSEITGNRTYYEKALAPVKLMEELYPKAVRGINFPNLLCYPGALLLPPPSTSPFRISLPLDMERKTTEKGERESH
jgi:hypothetical protein